MTKNSNIQEAIERILTALRYKGIDVKRPTYITTHELVISTSDSFDGLQTDSLGENITWRDFFQRELQAAEERGFAKGRLSMKCVHQQLDCPQCHKKQNK